MMTENKIFFPVIMRGKPPPLSLGAQIEGHIGSKAKWIIPNRQYQIAIKWRDVEQNKGQRDWSGYDLDFEALAGKCVTVGVKCVPEWARLWLGYVGSPPIAYYYPELAKFIMAVIERYRPDAIELFNEPDTDRDEARWAEEFFGAWCIDRDFYRGGYLYGQMTDTVYSMVHEAYPNVRIIAGALMMHTKSLNFLDGAIAGGLQCDAISFHKYLSPGGDFNTVFRLSMEIRNRINKPIVLSETSIMGSDQQQAAADYLGYLIANREQSCIDVIQWYTLADNEWSQDLIVNRKPTPAYEVWKGG